MPSRRPSPAMVVALTALFVALSGTTYAAVKLNGKKIVNHSIAGKKLKDDTLKGKQIDEAQLGQVPSALNADRLGGAGPQAFLPVGGTAANAQLLDNQDSTEFLGVGATAANAQQLDGKNSTEFLTSAFYARQITGATGPDEDVSCDTGDPAIAGGVSGNLGGAPINVILTGINNAGTGFFQIGWTGSATPNIEVTCLNQTP